MVKKDTDSDSLYLRQANLCGYKSIVNVDIEFQKGLNIIIGKNAAGKTNFLKFLSKSLLLDYNELNNFSSNLFFKNGKDVSIKVSGNTEFDEIFNNKTLNSKVDSILTVNGKKIKDKGDKEATLKEKLIENNIVLDSTFLCHGLPSDYLIVDKPFSFNAEKKKLSSDVFNIFRGNSGNPYFLKCLAIDIVLEAYDLESFEIDNIHVKFNSVFKRIETLKNVLKLYSPIEDIRFSKNYNIFIEENKESFTLNNLFLEFKIEGNWLPFSNLSDGTKRLFYIISELSGYESKKIRPSNNGTYYPEWEISRIILIEEPELGIHPHQFHKLMEFLKEQAIQKQIIITTHSPQALDALDENEFNRIIIAFSTKSQEGTKLRHLTEEELIKANAYIKEDFLSDYWLYSDLEK
ncbi:AAA family ATPase [Flavobacterium soyae]|uniref:AAA family ATPase n=1 Tax=Flavobacterium soyae TaxID=2903098 RepID=A0ABZ2UAB8_9FLAO